VSGANQATIGGPAGDGNIISGNTGDGILLQTSNLDVVRGNRIGTDGGASLALGNTLRGVDIVDGSNNVIGGTGAGAGNVISGNGTTTEPGVRITVSAGTSANNTVQANRIGTGGSALTQIPNKGPGVKLEGGANVHDNLIGGPVGGTPNVIAYNAAGVVVGNSSADATAGNRVQGNSIFGNTPGLPIDLGNDGLTLNDAPAALDGDTGPNGLQNFPAISAAFATASSTHAIGALDSSASTTYTLDFYRSSSCADKGQAYVGSATVHTDVAGHGTFDAPTAPATPGQFISATATNNVTKNTSELSACALVKTPVADLSVSLGVSSNLAHAGTPLTYTIHFANGGPDDAPNARAVFNIPDGADFMSSSPACSHSGSTVTCVAGSLAAGTVNHFGVTVTPRQERPLDAQVTVSSEGSDPVSSNNTAAASTPDHLPPPTLHKTVDVRPVYGTVLIKVNGRFVPLKFGETIPLGAILDTTQGRVRLTSAKNSKGTTQTADFYQGQFRIGQTKGNTPVTMLTLLGPVDPCNGKAATRRRRRRRHLWGSGHGSFGTGGRYGSATVRGTIWFTEDRCDGTYFKVNRGVVAVRDFRRRKTILVPKGHSTFVKAH
jgi:uncharacterized repeat protein (TIGR01451 family)